MKNSTFVKMGAFLNKMKKGLIVKNLDIKDAGYGAFSK